MNNFDEQVLQLDRFLTAQVGDYDEALDVFYGGKRDEKTLSMVDKACSKE